MSQLVDGDDPWISLPRWQIGPISGFRAPRVPLVFQSAAYSLREMKNILLCVLKVYLQLSCVRIEVRLWSVLFA